MSFSGGKRILQFIKQFNSYNSYAFYSFNPKLKTDYTKLEISKKYQQLLKDQPILSNTTWKNLRSEVKKSQPYLKDINIDKILMTCIKTDNNCTAADKLKNGIIFFETLKELSVKPSVLLYTDLINLYCLKANKEQLSQEEVTDLLKM